MPYAEVNGLRMYYEEQGSGPPLVLLNGATGTLDEVWRGGWSSLWPYLGQQYRVVQFEQRGNGRTDNPGGQDAYTFGALASDTAALIEHLGLTPAHLAGFSEGGQVALELALSYPAVVRSVVGIGANYTNDDALARAGLQAALLWLDPDRIEREDPDRAADLARRHDAHHPAGHWREVLRCVIAELDDGPAYTVEDLQQVTVPTLWIAGDNDPWLPLDQLVTMKRCMPGAELLIVNHAEHGAQQSHPHIVGPAMVDFLNRCDEQRQR